MFVCMVPCLSHALLVAWMCAEAAGKPVDMPLHHLYKQCRPAPLCSWGRAPVGNLRPLQVLMLQVPRPLPLTCLPWE